jgi:hypothetical protein
LFCGDWKVKSKDNEGGVLISAPDVLAKQFKEISSIKNNFTILTFFIFILF